MVENKAWRPAVGDRVLAPWGLDRIEGRILDIYGPPGRPTALVAVTLEGADGESIGEETVSFPIAHLERAESETTS